MTDLNSLFNPAGTMVVGASATPGKLGAVMASSLATYRSGPALVNSRGTDGMHRSIADAVAAAPDTIDLAVLCVPAAATAQAIRESAAHGVKSALVCSGGFAEAGGEGLDFDAQVRSAVTETGIRLLGPNTSGFFVPRLGLRASFVPGVTSLEPGSVAVVAASGGINHVLSFHLQSAGVGVSLGVGIGAGLDITAPDVLDYLIGDAATRAVVLHLETVSDGPRLLDAVRRLSSVKPVIALVIGRNDVSEFAQSHTGALATSWHTTRAVLRQAGAVVVDNETELVDAATALCGRRPAPSPELSAGLVTGQAGPGLLIADALYGNGIGLPRLTEDSMREIGTLLPPITFQGNPVDTGRPGPGYPQILRTVAEDPSIDVLGVYGITEPVISLPDAVAEAGVADGLPVLIGVDGPDEEIHAARTKAAAAGVPLLVGPGALARGIGALAADARSQYLRSTEDGDPAEPVRIDAGGPWDEARSKDLLDALGFATPDRRVCTTRAEAHAALAELGGRVAVKLLDAAVLHKTEIGGVHLGITSPEELDAAFDALVRINARQVLVERMADGGVDLVLGVRRDPVFGPIAVLGLGGIATEVFADSTIRSLPVTPRSAAAMPDELAAAALLRGFRSGPTLDVAEIARLISVLGSVLETNPVISEIEINPLRLQDTGLTALDAVVISEEN
ncbi:acetate--CoA ligase family protein [Glutamicibacter sp. NPDC127525]|uniref:acetate--CoA ligase family protein n=1 Tax=unclassified Glutamicibacter TaxID=2627139 RepID=UPI003639B5C5